MTTDVQRLTNDNYYEEDISTDYKTLLMSRAIECDLITDEAIRLYIQGAMEYRINADMTHDEIKTHLSEVTAEVNERFKVNIRIPRVSDFTKRVKVCSHCGQLFYDATKRNQSVACSRNIAFDKNGNMLFRNGVILTDCLRELKASERRTSNPVKSINEYRLVSIDKLSNSIDDKYNVYTSAPKPVTFTNSNALKSFDSFMNPLNDLSGLDDKTKADILPSDPVSESQYKRDRERYLLTE